MVKKKKPLRNTIKAADTTQHNEKHICGEEICREFVERADDLITRVDGDGKLIFANRAAETVLGVNPEACVGLSVFDFIHPEDRNRTREWLNRCLRDRVSSATIEHRHLSRTGEIRQMLWMCTFQYDTSGRVLGVNSISHDITERKKVEEELAVFKRFAQASGQCIGMTDLEGRIIYGNPAILQLCGIEDLADIQGGSFSMYHREEDLEMMEKDVLPTILREGRWVGETILRSHTGKLTPVIAHNFLIHNERGEPFCIAAIMTDISERVKVRGALENSEKRFLELANTAGEVVWTATLDGSRHTYMNSAAERVYGRAREEFYQDPELWLKVIHQDDRQRVMESAQRLLEHGHREIEYRIVRPNQEIRWLLDRARVIMDAAGRPSEIGGIASDITSLKKAEKKLEKEDQLLRNLLDLQERERQLVAHDIHDGMVQDIVGAKMLYEGTVRDCVGKTQLGEQINQVEKLLDRAIAEARRLIRELRPLVLDEAGIIEAIKHLISSEYADPSFQVELVFPKKLDRLNPMLEGTVFRIVQEALTNAKRHSHSANAEVKLIQRDRQLYLEIRDHGVGFDPEKIPEKHFGLRGIRERARLFGGHATIESAPSQGCCIAVVLPIAEGE
ncbi:MAG: PAS domain S-box protein [Pirellulales bacterium]|nr:PAS domain S-box protein [Pirellulales bacterium]